MQIDDYCYKYFLNKKALLANKGSKLWIRNNIALNQLETLFYQVFYQIDHLLMNGEINSKLFEIYDELKKIDLTDCSNLDVLYTDPVTLLNMFKAIVVYYRYFYCASIGYPDNESDQIRFNLFSDNRLKLNPLVRTLQILAKYKLNEITLQRAIHLLERSIGNSYTWSKDYDSWLLINYNFNKKIFDHHLCILFIRVNFLMLIYSWCSLSPAVFLLLGLDFISIFHNLCLPMMLIHPVENHVQLLKDRVYSQASNFLTDFSWKNVIVACKNMLLDVLVLSGGLYREFFFPKLKEDELDFWGWFLHTAVLSSMVFLGQYQIPLLPIVSWGCCIITLASWKLLYLRLKLDRFVNLSDIKAIIVSKFGFKKLEYRFIALEGRPIPSRKELYQKGGWFYLGTPMEALTMRRYLLNSPSYTIPVVRAKIWQGVLARPTHYTMRLADAHIRSNHCQRLEIYQPELFKSMKALGALSNLPGKVTYGKDIFVLVNENFIKKVPLETDRRLNVILTENRNNTYICRPVHHQHQSIGVSSTSFLLTKPDVRASGYLLKYGEPAYSGAFTIDDVDLKRFVAVVCGCLASCLIAERALALSLIGGYVTFKLVLEIEIKFESRYNKPTTLASN